MSFPRHLQRLSRRWEGESPRAEAGEFVGSLQIGNCLRSVSCVQTLSGIALSPVHEDGLASFPPFVVEGIGSENLAHSGELRLGP